MQELVTKAVANAMPVTAGLCVAGAVCGWLDLVLPTTGFFLLAGLVLMAASGRRGKLAGG